MGQKRLTNHQPSEYWPDWLRQATKQSLHSKDYQPVVFDMEKLPRQKAFKDFCASTPITRVEDVYDEQLAELYISQNAQLFKASEEVKYNSIKGYLQDHYQDTSTWQKGCWVYYPWDRSLVHVLAADLFWKLRTIRNQILMTHDEQQQYQKFRIGCAGMSVGSNGALAIVLTSGSQQLKLADGAVFSGSNLNRVRTAVENIGINKAVVVAREIFKANPYMQLSVSQNNITRSTVGDFFEKPWPLDLVVDEIDDLEVKVLLRLEAKKRHIPLIMVTEPGNMIMLDVDRYAQNPQPEIFNGLAPGVEKILDKQELSQREKIKYIAQIIGLKNLPLRDQKAMIKVGSEIPSPPQLGSTAMIAGGVIAFAARQMAINPNNLKTGRHTFSLDEAFTHYHNSLTYKWQHKRHSAQLRRALKSM